VAGPCHPTDKNMCDGFTYKQQIRVKKASISNA
jgi:hypothetical protein